MSPGILQRQEGGEGCDNDCQNDRVCRSSHGLRDLRFRIRVTAGTNTGAEPQSGKPVPGQGRPSRSGRMPTCPSAIRWTQRRPKASRGEAGRRPAAARAQMSAGETGIRERRGHAKTLMHGHWRIDPSIRRSVDPSIRRSVDPSYLEAAAPVKVQNGKFWNARRVPARASPDASGANVAMAASLIGILTGLLTPPCCLRRDPEPRRTCGGDSRDLAWPFPVQCLRRGAACQVPAKCSPRETRLEK